MKNCCELCKSNDFVRVTVKSSKRRLIICCECEEVYEMDKDGNPVFGHEPTDVEYFEELKNSFHSWDELEEEEHFKLD